MAATAFYAKGLTGGAANDLDHIISVDPGDGSKYAKDGDFAIVMVGGVKYEYQYDGSNNNATNPESSPGVIVPDDNTTGFGAWILQGARCAGLEAGSVSAPTTCPTLSTKTADYSITTSDAGSIVELGAATAADKTFTLPSVGSDEDGYLFGILNNSDYQLTVAASDSDSIWNSGDGYGIELPDKGTYVLLRYNHSATRFDIIQKTGGLVRIEGLVLHEPFKELGSQDTPGTYLGQLDKSGKHRIATYGNFQLNNNLLNTKFGPACAKLDGAGDYGTYGYSGTSDFDVFADQTGVKTIAGWFRFDATGSHEVILTQYEDSQNRWRIMKSAGEAIQLLFESNNVEEISLQTADSLLSNNTWYHVAVVINGSGVGVYIDGTQVLYDGTWNTDTLSGVVYFGQDGASGNYFDGFLEDWLICYQNIFNATPNSTPDDSFTAPAGPMKLTM